MHAPSTTITQPRQSQVRRSASRSTRSRHVSIVEILLLVLTCSLVLAALFAVQPRHHTGDVPTRVIRVRTAETLWDIASTHPIEGLSTAQNVEVLRAINRLENSRLAAGQSLRVPLPQDAAVALANP